MRIACIVFFSILFLQGFSQSGDSVSFSAPSIHKLERFTESSGQLFSRLDASTTRATEKLLEKMQRREEKIGRKLQQKDSAAYTRWKQGVTGRYDSLKAKLRAPEAALSQSASRIKTYVPFLDSASTGFSFLKSRHLDIPGVDKAQAAAQAYAGKLQVVAAIREAVSQRKTELMEQFQGLGMNNQLQGINKQVYYYQAQLQEYKAMLKDENKLEQKGMELLRNSAAFQRFMQRNSMLASLFRLPGGSPDPNPAGSAIPGLQTRAGVQALVAQRLGQPTMPSGNGASADPQGMLQQQLQGAEGQLQSVKDRLNQLGSGGGSSNGELEIPDFKPNGQKTKSFLKRLETGFNFQTHGSTTLTPVITDIGLSLGYKLNDKGVAGIGLAYKLGLGRGLSDIRLTNEGVSLRSFVDVKVKGSWWITGGYEQNYLSSFAKFSDLQNLHAWQSSGLIGVTKKYKIGRKEGKLQLLWDFLAASQTPQAQAIQFRVGYGL